MSSNPADVCPRCFGRRWVPAEVNQVGHQFMASGQIPCRYCQPEPAPDGPYGDGDFCGGAKPTRPRAEATDDQ